MCVSHRFRLLPGWLLIVGVALAGLFHPPALRADTVSEAELRAVAEGFLAGFARRDRAEAFRWMTSDTELNQQFWDQLTEELSAQQGVELKWSKFRVRFVNETGAFGRIRLDWKSKDPRTARPVEGAQTLDLSYVRPDGTWKLHGFRFAERHVYRSFVDATSAEARADLLDRNPDLVAGWLPFGLRGEANTLADGGKLEEAERYNQLAFEVAEWMKSDSERAWCYLIRGYLRGKKREWNAALNAYEAARQLFEKIDDKFGLARLWQNSGWIYSTAGETRKSIEAYGKALKYLQGRGETEAEAATLQDLGVAQQFGGNPTGALANYEAALQLRRKLGDRKAEAVLLGNIGGALQDLRRYGDALRRYEEVRKICKEINDFSSEVAILPNLGNLYQVLGRFAEAEAALRTAVSLAREQKREQDELVAQHNLTVFYLRNNRLDEAGDSGYEAVKLAARLKNDRVMPQLWSNLGDIGIRLEAWKQARECFEEMLATARASEHRGMEALAVMWLGVVDLRSRDRPDYRASAARRYREAAELAAKNGATGVLQSIREHQGALFLDQREFAQAAVHLRQSIELVEQTRAWTEIASLQTSYLRQYAHLYSQLADCYVLTGEIEKAFAVSEQFKARSLVDAIRSGNTRITHAMSAQQRNEEEELEGRLARLSASLEKTVLTDALQQLTEERDRTRSQLEAFRERLYLQIPQLKSRRADFEPATPAELQAKLLATAPRTALVSYLVQAEQVLIFVLHRDRHGAPHLALHRSLIGRAKLRKAVEAHWQACSSSGGEYENSARLLFQHLIAPAAPELAGKDHLILVPDVELGNLAFAALVDTGGRPLATKYALSYAPSATALLRMLEAKRPHPAPRDRVPLLAFGNPVFPTRMPELPASAAEVKAISRLFGARAVTRLGEQARESEAHALLGKARFVHFATHGTLDQGAPMYSSLVLARDDRNDGFLQARELADMDLSADLVVMSACETALGQKVRGEGILGLTWALFAAGASSTMASQWQVADESTRDLMTAFYRNLTDPKARMSRAEALRRAQTSLIRGKKHAHPYYWAPFVLLGQWSPVN